MNKVPALERLSGNKQHSVIIANIKGCTKLYRSLSWLCVCVCLTLVEDGLRVGETFLDSYSYSAAQTNGTTLFQG